MQSRLAFTTTLALVGRRWVHLLLASLLIAGGFTLTARPVAAQAEYTCVNKTTANGLGNNIVYGVYASGSTVYAATQSGLGISTDGGVSFTNKTSAIGLGNSLVYGVYASGSTVYAATLGGLSISTDGGASFINKTTANGLGNNIANGVYASGSTVYAATYGGGVSISTDGGASFTNKTTTNGLGNNTVDGVYAVGSTVYAATDGGVSISTDGGASFTNKTTATGLGNNFVLGVYASGSTVYAATYGGGVSISTDGGASFTTYTTANGLGNNWVRVVYASGSTVYAATYGGGVAICTQSGPNVSVPTRTQGIAADNTIHVPVQFASKGKSIAATGFALNYDTTCLRFDPTDANKDGIPDAITGLDKLPANFVASVNYTDTTKLSGVALYQPTSPVTAQLSDGTLFTATFTVQASCIPSDIATKDVTVGFAASPKPSFGDSAAQDVTGSATNGTLTLYHNNPPTAITLDNNRVGENSAVGTPVGLFSSTDLDAGDTFTYTLVSGTGSDDNASFSISGRTLNTRASFD
ncbi:MAG: hypothetical protein U0350_41695 [Caldilineaceae bacterium]